MRSALYWGRVRHHRFLPREHRFDYRVAMFLLFLDELDQLEADLPALRLAGEVVTPVRSTRAPWWPGRFTLRRRDFLPDLGGTLEDAARESYRLLTGETAPGRVAMLANLRSLGWNFNPITLYFYFEGERVVAAIAEVTNTPWNERHRYLLHAPGETVFAKAHHVSPFLEMAGVYRLVYREPGEHFTLSMSLFDLAAPGETYGPRRFSASMSLERTELSRASLRRLVLTYPDMAFRVSLRIYLQAARIFAKRVPYVSHPKKQKKEPDVVSPR